MKKLIALTVLGAGLLFGAGAYAQGNAEQTAADKAKTQQVIESIPALKSIALEISGFEIKIAGKKEEYKNANADLKALKQKYANELTTQINANEGKKEIVDVLNAELKKTKNEIENLK